MCIYVYVCVCIYATDVRGVTAQVRYNIINDVVDILDDVGVDAAGYPREREREREKRERESEPLIYWCMWP